MRIPTLDLKRDIFTIDIPDMPARQMLLESKEFYEWLSLDDSHSFRVVIEQKGYTARKEYLKTGIYWYAYARQNGKLHKAYLGKKEAIHKDRLYHVFTVLMQKTGKSPRTNKDLCNLKQQYPDYKSVSEDVPDRLLSTKIQTPPIRSDFVVRTSLLSKLNAGISRKLTVVSAPAGYGKTSLLAQWVSVMPLPVAWLSLDKTDNDLTYFLQYLCASLNTIPLLNPLPVIDTSNSSDVIASSYLTKLINHIHIHLHSNMQHFAIILDNYSMIEEKNVHDVLDFLIQNAPDQMHIIIAGRGKPPFRLAIMRSRGELTEINADDLQFSKEETYELLNNTANDIVIPDTQVSALLKATEGWIAGIRMALSSLRENDRSFSFSYDLIGKLHNISDYLLEEVFAHQPSEIQDFLLKTSFLNRLTAPLCECVTDQKNSQELLDKLDYMCVFLTALNAEHTWFQYHSLFADFLRSRFTMLFPDYKSSLLCRAAAWCEANGYFEEAVDYYIQASAFEKAMQVLHRIAPRIITNGQDYLLVKWLSALPHELLKTDVQLCLWYAIALGAGCKFTDCEKVMKVAEDSLTVNYNGHFASQLMSIRSHFAFLQGDIKQSIELVKNSLSIMPYDDIFNRGFACLHLAVPLCFCGNVQEASIILAETQKLGSISANPFVEQMSMAMQGFVNCFAGKLKTANSIFQGILDQSQERQIWFPRNLANIGMSIIFHEWRQLPEALLSAQKVILEEKLEWLLGWAYQCEASIKLSTGNYKEAWDALDIAESLFLVQNRKDYLSRNYAHRALLSLAENDLRKALSWIKECGLGAKDDICFDREFEYFTYIRILNMVGRSREAIPILTEIKKQARNLGRWHSVIESICLEAWTYKSMNDMTRALILIGEAIRLAQNEGYCTVFINKGESMSNLLEIALKAGIEPSYCAFLLKKFDRHIPIDGHSINGLIETVSEREIEIIKCMATGISNAEIAKSLFISENTVKRHLSNIFAKLGVNKRVHAIVRCQELGLI